MDDLIVIILTLIVAGVGALSQLKKKKQAADKTNGENSPDSFWDLLQGESNLTNYTEELEFESISEPPTSQQEVKADKFKYQTAANNESQSISNNKLKKEKSKIKSKLNEDFSLRKAVIYSEILNRKYT